MPSHQTRTRTVCRTDEVQEHSANAELQGELTGDGGWGGGGEGGEGGGDGGGDGTLL